MKKMMKKIAAGIGIFVLLLSLASCGSGTNSKYVGTWKATTIEAGGFSLNLEELGVSLNMNIKDDGTFTMTEEDAESEDMELEDLMEGSGTWEEKEGGIEISNGEEVLMLSDTDDGNLEMTVNEDGSEGTIIFTRNGG